VQISDENLHHVREIMDEVFGPKNFVSVITFRKKSSPQEALEIPVISDFLIWYAKDKKQIKYRQLYVPKIIEEEKHEKRGEVKMKHRCEIFVSEYLPSLRSAIAKTLNEKYKLSQVEISEIMGITQPAVSQYIKSKRGFRIQSFSINDKIDELCSRLVSRKINVVNLSEEMCKLCELLTKNPDINACKHAGNSTADVN